MSSTSPDLPYARIYGGPLEDFVRRRDALVRELRSAGDRDAANAVKGLRKPSRVAWALDQGAITARDSFDALADAAAALVKAQSSGGDARAAMAALRDAVRSFAENAADAAGSAGHRTEPGALMGAVHAVLGRQDSFEQLRSGCLVDVPEAGGLDVFSAFTMQPAAATSAPAAGATVATPRRKSDEREQAARAAVEAAASALDDSRSRLERANADTEQAEAQLADAEQRVRKAEADARAARQRVASARKRAESVAAEVRKAEQALERARRNVPQA